MSTAAQTVKRWNLCPECVCELDWEPASGCWYCHDCCTHQDTPRVMVDAEDYTALERRAPTWQPIETAGEAKKTNEPIIVWYEACAGRRATAAVWKYAACVGDCWHIDMGYLADKDIGGWMPLPAPPDAGGL